MSRSHSNVFIKAQQLISYSKYSHSCFSANTINSLQYKGKNNLFHGLFLNTFPRLTPFKIMSETRWDVTPFSSNKFMVLSDGFAKQTPGSPKCTADYHTNQTDVN